MNAFVVKKATTIATQNPTINMYLRLADLQYFIKYFLKILKKFVKHPTDGASNTGKKKILAQSPNNNLP